MPNMDSEDMSHIRSYMICLYFFIFKMVSIVLSFYRRCFFDLFLPLFSWLYNIFLFYNFRYSFLQNRISLGLLFSNSVLCCNKHFRHLYLQSNRFQNLLRQQFQYLWDRGIYLLPPQRLQMQKLVSTKVYLVFPLNL